ncbi:MAG: tRNA pseudouridine(13) synthase TruD [archaeon]
MLIYKKVPEDFIVEEITPEKIVIEFGKEYEFENGQGPYLKCYLEKVNWDNHVAFKKISKLLHVSVKRIGFAGTKDKKACTTQRISIWGIKKEQIEKLKIKDMRIIPIKYSDKPVELGDLYGNRFTVKIYCEKFDFCDEIPNFYGFQRFGETRPITHKVGLKILQGDLEGAVKSYLCESFGTESKMHKEVRERLAKDFNYKEALTYFPKSLYFERLILSHLVRYPNDYAGALRKLPKFLKIMFIHAVQAWLFNKFLLKNMKEGRKYADGPLFGYELECDDFEQVFLESFGLKKENFLVKKMPEMSSKGERRPCFVKVEDFKILERTNDFLKIRFSLPKSSYATVALSWWCERDEFLKKIENL